MADRSFVDGLVALDAVETRKRLAAALVEARGKTSGRGGNGVAEAIQHVESVLRESAQWAIRRIDAALVEARAVAARPETMDEAFAAVVAALDSDSPIRPEVSRLIVAALCDETPPGC